MKIKKGDTVEVISGKEKGKKAKVLKVLVTENKVLLEGLNIAKKHQKPSQKGPGGIVEIPKPLFASKVKIVCPGCSKSVKVTGKRICKECKSPIDKEK